MMIYFEFLVNHCGISMTKKDETDDPFIYFLYLVGIRPRVKIVLRTH